MTGLAFGRIPDDGLSPVAHDQPQCPRNVRHRTLWLDYRCSNNPGLQFAPPNWARCGSTLHNEGQ
jgi:hypothetical protein